MRERSGSCTRELCREIRRKSWLARRLSICVVSREIGNCEPVAGSLANSSSLLPDKEKRRYAQESRARQVIAHETDSVVCRELRGDVRSKRSAQDPRQIERKRRARTAYGRGKQRSKR